MNCHTILPLPTGDSEIPKNLEDQKDELLVLSSIYDEKVLLISEKSSLPSGQFILHPVLPENFHVICNPADNSGLSKPQEVEVQFLLPIVLHFHLPETYPSKTCPAFLLSCQWITLKQLSALCSQLENLWKEGHGEVILFRWTQFLQEEALAFLGIKENLDISLLVSYQPEKYNRQKIQNLSHIDGSQLDALKDTTNASTSSHLTVQNTKPYKHCFKPQVTRGNCEYDCRAIVDLVNGAVLLPKIIEYDQLQKEETFIQEWHTCKVCLSEKQGANCMRFHGCDHVYCRGCMKGYFSIQIQDGNVKFLTCPDDKCSSQALPSQVYELVGPELFARYDEILLAATLDSMSDITYCPRISCQTAVMLEPDYPMACCPACQYVFCVFCKRAYHGLAPCRFRPEERRVIRDAYLTATKKDKHEMEKRYGRTTLQQLVNDTLTEDWLQDNSKNCPQCSAAIEKSDGCNKMVCWRCATHFCWLCRCRLNPTNPYLHFSDSKSECYNQLFFGIAEDDDWQFGEFL